MGKRQGTADARIAPARCASGRNISGLPPHTVPSRALHSSGVRDVSSRWQAEALSDVCVSGGALAVFLLGFLTGWRRRKSSEQRAACAEAARDEYLALNRSVSAQQLKSLNVSWSAEKAALLAKHAASLGALEQQAAAVEKSSAKRLQEATALLEDTQRRLRDKESVICSIWGSVQALEDGVAGGLTRELAQLRAAQRQDACILDVSPASPARRR